MSGQDSRTCVECQGAMSPIVIMDKSPGLAKHSYPGRLEYRLPDDRVSFWTGLAGKVSPRPGIPPRFPGPES